MSDQSGFLAKKILAILTIRVPNQLFPPPLKTANDQGLRT